MAEDRGGDPSHLVTFYEDDLLPFLPKKGGLRPSDLSKLMRTSVKDEE
jgi:hypothetical protein